MISPEKTQDFIESLGESALSNTPDIDEFIKHHGVKGQKWGVRKDRGHEGEREKTKKIAKLDKKFAKAASTPKVVFALHNRAAELTNKNDIDRINNKPQYKGQDFKRDSPLRERYYKEHQRAFLDNLETAAKEMGTNASGTQKYSIVDRGGSWDVILEDVRHANAVMSVKVNYDTNGFITSLEIVKPVSHSVLEFIEHHGVKGMHWGVRKRENRVKVSSDFKKTQPHRGKKPSQLTNKQLKSVNERIALEQNYRRMNPSKVKVGSDMAKGILAALGTAASFYTLANSPAGKAAISAGKSMVKKKL